MVSINAKLPELLEREQEKKECQLHPVLPVHQSVCFLSTSPSQSPISAQTQVPVTGVKLLTICWWCQVFSTALSYLHQWSPTLGLQMFLDFNSQKSWLAEVVVKASGSCSPRTSGGPGLGTTDLHLSREVFNAGCLVLSEPLLLLLALVSPALLLAWGGNQMITEVSMGLLLRY